MRSWWMTGKFRHKVNTVVDLKKQTRELPDGSRISSLLSNDELIPYLYDDSRTIFEAVLRGLRLSNNGPMLGTRKKHTDGTEPFVWLSYEEVLDRSAAFGCGLISRGVANGEKNYIGFFANNCPEWIIAELGVYRIGGILVPLYATLGNDALMFIINQTEMEVVVCDNESRAVALMAKKACCSSLRLIVIIEEPSKELMRMSIKEGIKVFSFSSVETLGKNFDMKTYLKVPKPEDVCTVCYTSGTTGTPKGVVLTHGNVIGCITALNHFKKVDLTSKDVMISFLPLAHMYERVLECAMFQIGASVGYFRGDIRGLVEDIKELQPTIIPLVPRVLNRVHDKIISELGKSFFKKSLFDIAVALKRREHKNGILRNNSLLDKLIFKRIHESLGGHVRVMLCGSAPLAENVMSFARATMGCVVLEGYGQTECTAACTLALEGDLSSGHVGIPTVCNAIKLVDVPELGYFASDQVGEVCVRGYNVFQGYFKNEALTKEVLDEDGWLHTGDIGQWTSIGTLKIIDRKKHIFKLSQGEYIAPEKIENTYLLSKYVSQLFVHGDSFRASIVGVVVPEAEALLTALFEHFGIKGMSFEEVCGLEEAKKIILEDMIAVGKKAGLCSFEQVKDIHLYPELFTVENGLLTPTLKSKRPVLRKFFSTHIEKLYSALA